MPSILSAPDLLLRSIRSWLPTGESIDAADWVRRHRAISGLVWAHVGVVPVYGIVRGQDPLHAVAECSILVVLAVGASWRALSHTVRSVMATLGLVTASAILTHFADGLIEMHFHFFVVVAVVSLYQSWVPFLVALSFVVAHHGIGGQVAPRAVFNHPSAVNDAWRWALVHGGFILAESAACLVAWRLNEVALDNERSARQAMAQAHDDLAAAQSMSNIGSWEWNTLTGTVRWSDELYRIVDRDPATFVPSVTSFLDHIVPTDRQTIADMLEVTRQHGIPLDFECHLIRADGSERVVHVTSDHAVRDHAAPTTLMGTCQDITQRKALEAELHHQAFHDNLTGLPNRALFLDRLQHGLALTKRTGTPLSLIYVDIDDFKTVNDNLGHDTGDALLTMLARRLAAAVRAADTVARLGGDEFAILLEDTDEHGAALVADKLLDALIEPCELHGNVMLARASMGIAVATPTDQPGDLLRHADIAMYTAKRQGKHSYRLFNDGMHASLAARMELEAQLHTAIQDDQLVIHYQPLIDLDTDQIAGVEALVRWDHPDRGLLPPSEFIPLAEETGQIAAVGTWVLNKATADVRQFQDVLGRPVYVSVNVAAPQLCDGFVDIVQQALTTAGLAPEHLLLELTETCLVSDDVTIVPQLATLRALGVRIAIDDFGTGYSSLAYLRQLPVDHLKIDRSFIRDLTDNPEGSALVQSIIQLGATFGLHVVGEGIENADQAALLRRLGCQTGQGYHYQRPTDLESLLAAVSTPAAQSAVRLR